MAGEHRARGHRPGPVPAPRGRLRRAGGRPGRLRHRQHQEALRRPHRRHDHRAPQAGRRWPCPATRSRCRWSSAASSRRHTTSSRTCATALQKLALNDSSFTFEPETSDAPRLRLPLRLPGHAPHGDHPAAARSARATSSLVQTAPNVTYEILDTQGRDPAHLQPAPGSPTPARSRSSASRSSSVNFILPVRVHRRHHAALRGPPRHVRQDRIPHARRARS